MHIRLVALAFLSLTASAAFADDWPQWLGPKRDGVWRETGIIEKFPKDGPKVRWRTPINAGYSGPTVANGKVYVTDRIRNGDIPKAKKKSKVPGTERVVCLNEADGKEIWKYEYPCEYQISYGSGPRCSPIVDSGKLYTLGAMGHLFCFDADTGKIHWSKDLLKEYKMTIGQWGFAGHPLIDGDRLICLVGGKGSVAVAFDKNTGKELWKNLSATEPGYAPPMIYEIAGKRNLIIWHPEGIYGLEPQSGKVLWSQNYGSHNYIKAGLTVPTPRQDGSKLFFTAFYDGPIMLQFNDAGQPKILWQGKGTGELPERTDGLHSIMPTPIIKDGHIYGVCSYGELRCLDEATGKRIWETYKATTGKSVRWGNAFITPQADRYWLFNELGDLIIAKMSPKGYEEIDRVNILAPTNTMAGRKVVWSHPAFANRCVYARNDKEIVCISLAK
ncbi:MAG TPA: PQQ-binding-like beta-propeller repeat protein [Gemmataceae bacterium]|nr:PQQ-binding-like beta-propeller repeat protein [Gemmataceae bacterium]